MNTNNPRLSDEKQAREMIEDYIRRFMPESWQNLPLKYHGKRFDAHTHFHYDEKADITNVMQIADDYHMEKIVAILHEDNLKQIQESYPDRFVCARFLQSQRLLKHGPSALAAMVDEIYSQGYSIVKFWFAPRWKDYVKEQFGAKKLDFKLSQPAFAPLFERLQDLRLNFLIHISDPDLWYQKKYLPESFYGSKAEHLADLEEVIKAYPKIQFQIAHFGAQPEDLANLGRWLDTYPNIYIDTASARWIGRELSRNPEKSKLFIQAHADRILYGTDLSFGWTRDGTPEEYFLTRYLTFHTLFETARRGVPLPFPDPENENQTILNGLDLPVDTLEKIYWKNAFALYC